MAKIGIFAGTHQRETSYSHPVADLLLQEHGAKEPLETFVGDDNATRAQVWNLGDLVIAKIFSYGTGEPSAEWLERQPIETLVRLAQHKIDCHQQKRPPRIAEAYGNNGQWTSVHSRIISDYNLLFFVDLHSAHVYTEGLEGKGLQINSYARPELNDIIASALSRAQASEPEIYGKTLQFTEPVIPLDRFFEKQDAITLLQSNLSTIESMTRKFRIAARNHKDNQEVARDEEFERLVANGWYFVPWGNPEPRGSYFLFEAHRWNENQQKATAKFIRQYLLPEVRKGPDAISL